MKSSVLYFVFVDFRSFEFFKMICKIVYLCIFLVRGFGVFCRFFKSFVVFVKNLDIIGLVGKVDY